MLLIIDRTGKLISPNEDDIHVALALTKGVRLAKTTRADEYGLAYLTKVYDRDGSYYVVEKSYMECSDRVFWDANEAVADFLEVMRNDKVQQSTP